MQVGIAKNINRYCELVNEINLLNKKIDNINDSFEKKYRYCRKIF